MAMGKVGNKVKDVLGTNLGLARGTVGCDLADGRLGCTIGIAGLVDGHG